MNDFYDLILPREIRFRSGAANELPGLLPALSERILFIAGNHAVKSGDAATIIAILEQAGKKVILLSGVPPEPAPAEVDKLIKAGRDNQCDAVVALGGGSVIDAAKAAAALIPAEGWCQDYFTGAKKITEKGLFFVALPASAGTGAEMTSNSVLTDPETQIKQSLRSPYMVADVALVDPHYTITASPYLTACCGLDAFVQAAEAFTSTRGNSFTKPLALTALKKIAHALPAAYKNGNDMDARTEQAEGSMLTGIAFAQCGLGAIHGLAHPCGSLLSIPHGAACAILMTSVFRFNAETCPEPYAEMARALAVGNTAEDFVAFAASLAKELNIPSGMKEYGLQEEHFDFIVKNCRSGSMKSNPRYMTDEDARQILSGLMN
ncbi:MAG: iron-containing alcohol dehydrogenase [Lentisphaeria bacterium]|nr:iron-containing alcohol dehydrogenase [Lentisphaeria bacterium]